MGALLGAAENQPPMPPPRPLLSTMDTRPAIAEFMKASHALLHLMQMRPPLMESERLLLEHGLRRLSTGWLAWQEDVLEHEQKVHEESQTRRSLSETCCSVRGSQ